MEETQLKSMIEQIIEQMISDDSTVHKNCSITPKKNSKIKQENSANINDDGVLEDISKIDLKKQFLVDNPKDKEAYLEMKQKTPARLGIGKAGARYKTETMLRVRADHAAAQDAVFSDVSQEFIDKNNFVFVKTLCKDKDEYVTRPDLGRRFDEKEQGIIRNTYPNNPKIIIVVGDGLSSSAIEANAEDIIPSIKQGLKAFGIEYNEKILFVKYARVGSMDAIGEVTGADCICMLIGERPGLVTAESMSAYIAYKPKIGLPEAKRTVISNIHKGGTTAVEAGAHIADVIKRILDKKASGIDLK